MILRNMTMDDADFMLELKNYPETRKFAVVTQDEIKREDHIKWLPEHLNEFQVLEKSDKTRVGAIRISRDGEISIWVKREFWELGIATKILSGYYNTSPNMLYGVWAKIVDGNISSFRAFIKGGFKPVEHKDNYYILRK